MFAHFHLFVFIVIGVVTGHSTNNKEYIVTLHQGFHSFKHDLDTVHVIRSFHIDNWTSILIRTSHHDDVLQDPHVASVERNCKCVYTSCTSQSTKARLWGLSRLSSRSQPDYRDATYKYNHTGEGVDVYIVDSGIYLENEDFNGRATHGFTAPGITEGDTDLNGHGTHCAGIAGSTTYGVAKEAHLVAVKVLDASGVGFISDAVAGVEYVHNQHKKKTGSKSVMSMSLGTTAAAVSLAAAVDAAVNGGVSAAVAAGNRHADACGETPANVRSAITVTASTINDEIAGYANVGDCVDVVAPGSNIWSTYIGSKDAIAQMSGTSMAAPYIAGWVAMYLSRYHGDDPITPREVKRILRLTSTKGILDTGSDDVTPNLLAFSSCQSCGCVLRGQITAILVACSVALYSLIIL